MTTSVEIILKMYVKLFGSFYIFISTKLCVDVLEGILGITNAKRIMHDIQSIKSVVRAKCCAPE